MKNRFYNKNIENKNPGQFLIHALLIMLSFSLTNNLFSQATITITGKITDSASGNPVSNVNVLLKNISGTLIHFSISDNAGRYKLSFRDTAAEHLFIETSCIGYTRSLQELAKGKNIYDFLLKPSITELANVKVISRPPISSEGDTLSYNVNSFARKEDRSIGDVIRHMPGMAVGDDGQISFNGRNISNLYIHGDDLMSGRYGLATKSIAKEMIKSVDVMQNFQPVKVLQNKLLTDDVAVNLVLKDENSLKVAGQAMTGAGLPGQFDEAVNLMMFNKTFKMLNSLKGNNSGIDYRNDFARFGATDFFNSKDNNRPNELLSAATAGDPDIPRQNYYLNTSGVLNTNNLYNTKDSLQLKSNVQLYVDRNTLHYNSNLDTYLPNDTIHYVQFQNALRKPFQLNTGLTLQANKSRYYFNENLSFNFTADHDYSNITVNGKAFDQKLTAHTYDISNDLSWIPLLHNKNILSLRWYLNYYQLPQSLDVAAGLDNDILNNSKPFISLLQRAETPSYFSNLSAAYIIGRSTDLIKQVYETGIINESQQLNSSLSLTQMDGSINNYIGDAGNALKWQRDKIFITATYSLKKSNWQAGLSLPLYLQSIHFRQDEYKLDQTNKNIFFTPAANIRLYTNAEDYLSATCNFNNNTGKIQDVYRGLILTNYLSLNANDAGLQDTKGSVTGVFYNFQRSVIMLFMNAGFNYAHVRANSILSSIITDNVRRMVLLPYDNEQNRLSANLGISKYIFALKTKFSMGGTWNRISSNQFINTRLYSFSNDFFTLTAGIDEKLPWDFTFNYTGKVTWNTSRQQNTDTLKGLLTTFKNFDHEFVLGYAPPGRIFILLKAKQSYSKRYGVNDINYLFMDANIRYHLSKLNADFELSLNNLFNIQDYKVITLSSNQLAINNYAIRGRMAIIRATFNL